MKHGDIIKKMTLEEKCAYLSGKNAWATIWGLMNQYLPPVFLQQQLLPTVGM